MRSRRGSPSNWQRCTDSRPFDFEIVGFLNLLDAFLLAQDHISCPSAPYLPCFEDWQETLFSLSLAQVLSELLQLCLHSPTNLKRLFVASHRLKHAAGGLGQPCCCHHSLILCTKDTSGMHLHRWPSKKVFHREFQGRLITRSCIQVAQQTPWRHSARQQLLQLVSLCKLLKEQRRA